MARIKLHDFEMNVEVHEGVLPMDTVFIHGNLASNRWWNPTLEVLKENARPGYEGRAIFAEWRGSGDSAAPQSSDELAMDRLAQDYNNLLEKLDVKRACLVGHSTGGLIGLIAMSKRPSAYHRAFLLDTVAADGVKFEQPMYEAFTSMSRDRDFCAMILGSTIHGNDARNAYFQELVNDAFRISKHNWHGVPNALAHVNVVEELKELKIPVCVAHGEHDAVLPIEKSRELASILPNAHFVEVKGQGHCTNVENPDLFVSLVNEFLYQ